MKIVGVTSCTIGMAHTYMCAEALEKYFRGLGHDIKIERDGNLGPDNELTKEDLETADVIVIAAGGDLYDQDRFDKYKSKTIEVSVYTSIRHPETVLDAIKEQGFYKD